MRGKVLIVLGALFLLFVSSLGAPPPAGTKIYTVQVASFTDRREAERVLSKLSSFPDARISYRNGRYKVRVGFFKSFKDAQEFVKSSGLLKVVSDYYITRITFSPEGVYFLKKPEAQKEKPPALESKSALSEFPQEKAERKTPEKEAQGVELPPPQSLVEKVSYEEAEEKETEPKPECADVSRVEKETESESKKVSEVKKEEKREVFSYKEELPKKGVKKEPGRWPYVLGALALLFLLLLFKRGGRNEEYFENYIAKLLDEGKYEEIVDIAVPYLSRKPEDTFVRKALAESYEKLGRYLEAAELYSEIASELERKGLGILAEGFKKKAEELYGKEFKK